MRDFDEATVRAIARGLSRWFEQHARDLPWRQTRDPYAIWVSEIMLQQTRVDTVERHWGRFMERFPDLASLASADEDAVLQQWSGLGYYRRARLLHRGAKHVHEALGGVLPRTAEQLRDIPGVGPYTAGAISSIAFDQPAALVDGNVARVHSRLAAIEDPAEQDAKAKSHWRFVERVLAHGRPRVLAQALMELGATVCTPRSPSCLVCPVRKQCRAYASGRQDVIPAVKVKQKSPEQQLFAVALRRGERVLLERRPEDGLLAGLWCLPLFECEDEELTAESSERFGVSVRLDAEAAGTVKHVFTHRVWHVQVWPARSTRAVRIVRERLAWWGPEEQPEGGVPTLTRKLLRVL
jgi:A/G-specific adenine glycosylase